jgi:hypothetical protein
MYLRRWKYKFEPTPMHTTNTTKITTHPHKDNIYRRLHNDDGALALWMVL